MTKPISELDMTTEEFIVYVARVSNPSNQFNHATAPQLLKYCHDHGHFSVFEMVDIIFEIVTTRDISRQILRHRSFSFQEFSQRYANPVDKLGFVKREARLQDKKNRQNSIITEDEYLQLQWKKKQEEIISHAEEVYNWAIENNIAREQSRVVLPEGLTLTRLYMKGSLRSWIHYCNQRSKNGTQLEHTEIAKECWKQITEALPALKFDIVQ